MCLKRILCCSFHGWRNFGGERFLTGKHLTSSGTKTTGITDFKLCTHISNRMLNKNVPSFFLTRVIFYFNNSTSFESLFCMKTVKSRLFKKYLKRKKNRQHGFVCSLVAYVSVQMNYLKLQFC